MDLKATTGQVERHGDCIIIAAGTTGYVIEAASGLVLDTRYTKFR